MRLQAQVEKRLCDFTLQLDLCSGSKRLGLFGRSGSGKSTLALLLAGLLRPDRGRIELDGEPLFCSERGIDLAPPRRRIGLVFQQAHLFPHLSVAANLVYGYRRTPAALRRVERDELVAALDLAPLLERGVATLSGGERQRVALGRALLASPRLLIMDEPLSALDEGLKFQIIPYLQTVFDRFGIPFLLISHALNELRLLSDEVIVLHHGRCSGQMSPEELARQRMGWSRSGYINLLRLGVPQRQDDLFAYPFGSGALLTWVEGGADSVFELSSKDVMLFKGRPEAISARNLLPGRVVRLFELENRIGVELDCGGAALIATVVRQAARELGLRVGDAVHAVIKASAFRKLY